MIENVDQLISSLKGLDKNKIYLIELTEEAVSDHTAASLIIEGLRRLLKKGIKAVLVAPHVIKNIYALDLPNSSDIHLTEAEKI